MCEQGLLFYVAETQTDSTQYPSRNMIPKSRTTQGGPRPAADDELSAQLRNDQTTKKVANTVERSIESSG